MKFETEVLDIIQRTPDSKSFRFAAPKGFVYLAGQYFFVTLKINGQEKTKHFSFSTSPTEKGYIEFTKKITDSEFSKALDGLRKGDLARIMGPEGKFVYGGEKKLAFLSGGIGITPLRSMMKYVVDGGIKTDIILLYSNKTPVDIVFKEELEDFDKKPNIRIVNTITSPDALGAQWNGMIGRIDESVIRKEIPDFRERAFYVCGPPVMVEAMLDALKRLNVENIRKENFSGY
ncbi:MAG: oxidoreductase [Candidatus Altiarchaeota archaeon]|nr:oxidoreductase [Candidatus Altiarchaeota archaeon]